MSEYENEAVDVLKFIVAKDDSIEEKVLVNMVDALIYYNVEVNKYSPAKLVLTENTESFYNNSIPLGTTGVALITENDKGYTIIRKTGFCNCSYNASKKYTW